MSAARPRRRPVEHERPEMRRRAQVPATEPHRGEHGVKWPDYKHLGPEEQKAIADLVTIAWEPISHEGSPINPDAAKDASKRGMEHHKIQITTGIERLLQNLGVEVVNVDALMKGDPKTLAELRDNIAKRRAWVRRDRLNYFLDKHMVKEHWFGLKTLYKIFVEPTDKFRWYWPKLWITDFKKNERALWEKLGQWKKILPMQQELDARVKSLRQSLKGKEGNAAERIRFYRELNKLSAIYKDAFRKIIGVPEGYETKPHVKRFVRLR